MASSLPIAHILLTAAYGPRTQRRGRQADTVVGRRPCLRARFARSATVGTSSQEGQELTVNQARSSQVDWYRLPVAEIEARLDTALASGLTEAEVKRRLAQYGANEVQDHEGPEPLADPGGAAYGRDDCRIGRGSNCLGRAG